MIGEQDLAVYLSKFDKKYWLTYKVLDILQKVITQECCMLGAVSGRQGVRSLLLVWQTGPSCWTRPGCVLAASSAGLQSYIVPAASRCTVMVCPSPSLTVRI